MSNKNRVFKIMAALFVLLIIIIPLLINEAYKRDKGYITVWGGADVLSYYGAVLSAIGTTVLGVIAWKQNTRLVEIEERSFLSDNIGAIWIEAVEIKGTKTTAVNPYSEHLEQVIESNKLNLKAYRSLSFYFTIKSETSSAQLILVRVPYMNFWISTDRNDGSAHIRAVNKCDAYSKIAMHKGYYQFEVTVLMGIDESKHILEKVGELSYDESSLLTIEMELSLLTNRYVDTHLKCITKFSAPQYSDKEDIYGQFKMRKNDDSSCFWENVYFRNKEDIDIKKLTDRH